MDVRGARREQVVDLGTYCVDALEVTSSRASRAAQGSSVQAYYQVAAASFEGSSSDLPGELASVTLSR